MRGLLVAQIPLAAAKAATDPAQKIAPIAPQELAWQDKEALYSSVGRCNVKSRPESALIIAGAAI